MKEYRWQSDRKNIKGKLYNIYYDQKTSSRERGHHQPKYTKEEFISRYMRDPKYIKLYFDWVLSGFERDLTPSFDRIDNSKGYTFDNIAPMTFRQNTENAYQDKREGRLGLGRGNKLIPVAQYDLQGNFIKKYRSRHEAMRETGVCNVNISNCANPDHPTQTAGGYVWKNIN